MNRSAARTALIVAGLLGFYSPIALGQQLKSPATTRATELANALTTGLREKELKLANDATRVAAWRLAPADRPDDVVCFALAPTTANDLARLVELLAAAGDGYRYPARIVLDPGKEPVLPDPPRQEPAARPAVVFSVGNYARRAKWFERHPPERLKDPEYHRPPPATLTLFIANPLIDLNALKIPPYVAVEPAYSDAFQEEHAKDAVVQRIDRFIADRQSRLEPDSRRVRLTVELDDPADEGGEMHVAFNFKIISPSRFAGKRIGAHHDGLLASGDPRSIANKGKRYYLRVFENDIGTMSACSVDLDLELIGPIPRERK